MIDSVFSPRYGLEPCLNMLEMYSIPVTRMNEKWPLEVLILMLINTHAHVFHTKILHWMQNLYGQCIYARACGCFIVAG